MSPLQIRNSERRGEHHYRRANLASEAVVARYLNDISGRGASRGSRQLAVDRMLTAGETAFIGPAKSSSVSMLGPP